MLEGVIAPFPLGNVRLRDQRAPAYWTELVMDLNYFYYRQQVSDFMSDNAGCDCSRLVHRKMADAYSLLIANAKIDATERAALMIAVA